jgi:uncharacterized membrane protein YfcA
MIEFLFIGAVAGIVMGAAGVGGGAIIIFLLSAFTHFPQKLAQGTALFIVAAPISLLAAFRYYNQGYVNIKAGLLVMISFLIFSLIGAQIAVHLPNNVLKIILGVILLLMGIKLIYTGWATLG